MEPFRYLRWQQEIDGRRRYVHARRSTETTWVVSDRPAIKNMDVTVKRMGNRQRLSTGNSSRSPDITVSKPTIYIQYPEKQAIIVTK